MIKLLSIVGPLKRGKSAVACSGPKPMIYFDLELGWDRVEDRFKEGDIKLESLDMGVNVPIQKQWSQFETAFNKALLDNNVKSIVLDTGSAVWEMRRSVGLADAQATKESREKLSPVEYTPLNEDMRKMFKQAKVYGKTLIIIHHVKEQYLGNKPTGTLIPDGFKETGDFMDLELWMDIEKGKDGLYHPYGIIKECGLSMAATGLKVPEPTYDKLETLVKGFRGEV